MTCWSPGTLFYCFSLGSCAAPLLHPNSGKQICPPAPNPCYGKGWDFTVCVAVGMVLGFQLRKCKCFDSRWSTDYDSHLKLCSDFLHVWLSETRYVVRLALNSGQSSCPSRLSAEIAGILTSFFLPGERTMFRL